MYIVAYKTVPAGSSAMKQGYNRDSLYQFLSPALKIALDVIAVGLIRDRRGKQIYDPKRLTWFSRIVRNLEGVVSRATIDRCLDSLLDESILAHEETEMVRIVESGQPRWIRGYHVSNEFSERLVRLYKIVHEEA